MVTTFVGPKWFPNLSHTSIAQKRFNLYATWQLLRPSWAGSTTWGRGNLGPVVNTGGRCGFAAKLVSCMAGRQVASSPSSWNLDEGEKWSKGRDISKFSLVGFWWKVLVEKPCVYECFWEIFVWWNCCEEMIWYSFWNLSHAELPADSRLETQSLRTQSACNDCYWYNDNGNGSQALKSSLSFISRLLRMPSANAPSWLVQKTLKAVPLPAPGVHGWTENDPLAGNRKQRI